MGSPSLTRESAMDASVPRRNEAIRKYGDGIVEPIAKTRRCHRIRPRASRYLLARHLLFLSVVVFQFLCAVGQVSVLPIIVDEEKCHMDMIIGDVDDDMRLVQSEFTTFLDLQSGGAFGMEAFSSLPSEIQDVFEDNGVCDCCGGTLGGCEFDGCCQMVDKYLNIAGAQGDATNSQTAYLFSICAETYISVEDSTTPAPIRSPSKTPTSVPTRSPTSRPTIPTTPRPTPIPTLPPTSFEPSARDIIVDFVPDSNTDGQKTTDGLAIGAVVGIALAAFFSGFCAIAVVYNHTRNLNDKHNNEEDQEYLSNLSPTRSTRSAKPSNLGAATPNYGRKIHHVSSGSIASLDESKSLDIESLASSSDAGNSGWSSSAGVSSLNTGSADSLEERMVMGGQTLAAFGVASGAVRRVDRKSGRGIVQRDGDDESQSSDLLISSSTLPIPNVTRADLDTAIEAGDWAAVGATAALLASTSSVSSRSESSKSITSRSTGTGLSGMDALRAAELDHLVDTGDWEGVVLAAGKFERGDGADQLAYAGSNSVSSDNHKSIGSAYTPGSGDVSASPSMVQKREEIRSEVEALVRRVVPDEIENVDEMMLQFRGREEELVETLRTMQERSIAQRARAAVHKSAKREARRSRREGSMGSSLGASGFPPRPPSRAPYKALATDAVTSANVAAVAAALTHQESNTTEPNRSQEDFSDPNFEKFSEPNFEMNEPTDTQQTPQQPPPIIEDQRSRTALERAIEAGDWDAVGEAAAMMSDNSVTTGSTGDLRNIAGDYAMGYDSNETSTIQTGNSIDQYRAAELDRMIDRGDWTGVVAAAGRFSSTNKKKGSDKYKHDTLREEEEGECEQSDQQHDRILSSGDEHGIGGSTTSGGSSTLESLRPKDKALQEEQDALAQAEIWMAIAAQSKSGNAAKGASDAADWAISRSLVALQQEGNNRNITSGSGRSKQSNDNQKSSKSNSSIGGGSTIGDRSV